MLSYADYAAVVLQDRPIGWWRLGDVAGQALDSSGHLLHGNYTGGIVRGQPGGIIGDPDLSALFGANGSVTLGNPLVLQPTNGTLEAWVKATTPGSGLRAVAARNLAFGLFASDGEFGTYDYNTSAARLTGRGVTDNQWHHLALSFQNGVIGGTTLYYDGVPVSTTTLTATNTVGSFYIGSVSSSQYWNGYIDEVAIYDTVLPAYRIALHYEIGSQGGVPLPGPRMVRYLPPYMRVASVLVALLEAQANELGFAAHKVESLFDQLLVRNATWRLDWFEEELQLPPVSRLTYNERRDRIIARLRAWLPPTPANILKIASSYQYGEGVQPTYNPDGWVMDYKFSGQVGRPSNIADLEAELTRITDAHLYVQFSYPYTTWGSTKLAGVTWARAKAAGITWANIRNVDPTTIP